jgi:hypothetical protein
MTEPSPTAPVPGAPRPVPGSEPSQATPSPDEGRPGEDRFAGLDEQAVAEHVAVFEAEHSRLERELGTIDQL